MMKHDEGVDLATPLALVKLYPVSFTMVEIICFNLRRPAVDL